MFIFRSILIFLLLLPSLVFAGGAGVGLLISEPDGTPSHQFAYEIEFPNNTISITNGVASFGGSASVTSSATTVNLDTDSNGAFLLMTAAGEVGLWDCSTATIGSWVTVWVRDAAEQVEVVMYGDTTNDLFRLKDGTELDANDEADMPVNGNEQATFMCVEANKWYVLSEDAPVTDGGAAD